MVLGSFSELLPLPPACLPPVSIQVLGSRDQGFCGHTGQRQRGTAPEGLNAL